MWGGFKIPHQHHLEKARPLALAASGKERRVPVEAPCRPPGCSQCQAHGCSPGLSVLNVG